MSEDLSTVIDAPARLLEALDASERRVPLDPHVAAIVARALDEHTWPALTRASRALRTLARFATEEGAPVPHAVTTALANVRAAMRQLRGRP